MSGLYEGLKDDRVGIGADLSISQGYDMEIRDFRSQESWYSNPPGVFTPNAVYAWSDPEDEFLTPKEVLELCDVMLARWNNLRRLAVVKCRPIPATMIATWTDPSIKDSDDLELKRLCPATRDAQIEKDRQL